MAHLTLSVQEVAEMLGVSTSAIYKAVRRGEIQSVKVGTRVMIPRAVIDELFDRPESAGTSS